MGIHIRGKFAHNLAFQVKSTVHLVHRYKAYQLSMFFSVPKDKLITHPNFWCCFGYFDMKAMAFANPVFIVPSAEVHSHAAPRLDGALDLQFRCKPRSDLAGPPGAIPRPDA
jgi:hypothetical protein